MLQLIEDGGVFQRRHVLGDFLALGQHAQQPPHDLAGTGLGQVVAETQFLGLGDRANLLADPVPQLLGDLFGLVADRARALEDDEGADYSKISLKHTSFLNGLQSTARAAVPD